MVSPAAALAAPTPVSFADAAGIKVVSAHRIDSRQFDVALLSAALGRPVHVRILVPKGYAAASARYPVLYLYTGTGGTAGDWVDSGQAEQTTASLPLITVMPDVGLPGQLASSLFVNWVDSTTSWGPSQWETFQVDQLIPWMDANLRTVAARSGRAIAGLSQGGYGAMVAAARHPDLFTSAAGLSGLLDIDYNPVIAAAATAFVAGITVANGVQPDAIMGSRLTHQANWVGHDPTDLLENMRPMSLWLFTGNGLPGPLDPTPINPEGSAIEVLAHAMTTSMEQRAVQLGIPIHLDDYGAGTHSFPYWARDLREYLQGLMPRFQVPPPEPTRITYLSVDPSWTRWGWSVSFQRSQAQELGSITGASAAGFTLRGTGAASVVTPPLYRPGSTAAVAIAGATQELTVDPAGRLHLEVPLGGSPIRSVIGDPDAPSTAGSATVTIRGVSQGLSTADAGSAASPSAASPAQRSAAPALVAGANGARTAAPAPRGSLPLTGGRTEWAVLAALALGLALTLRRQVRRA